LKDLGIGSRKVSAALNVLEANAPPPSDFKEGFSVDLPSN
jgi:hypothetical protein